MRQQIRTWMLIVMAMIFAPLMTACTGGGSYSDVPVIVSAPTPAPLIRREVVIDGELSRLLPGSRRVEGIPMTYRVIVQSNGLEEEIQIFTTYEHVVQSGEEQMFGSYAGTQRTYLFTRSQQAMRADGRSKHGKKAVPFVVRINNVVYRLRQNEGGQTGTLEPMLDLE